MPQAEQPATRTSLVLETREGPVVTLTMNRPERLNALNVELSTELARAMARVAEDPQIRVVVLTGTGRAFCSGGDLKLIQEARASGRSRELEPLLRAGVEIVVGMRTMPKPIIAQVNGPAAGAGMNLALASDIRIASEEAVLGQSFARVGLFPDYGATFLLPRLVGASRAAEMLYTGEMIDAREGERLGLLNRVVAPERLAAETRALAERLAQAPPLVVRGIKQVLFGNDRAELERALEFEVATQMRCFESDDSGEGIRAFFEKRPPRFQGR
ncbi:MAG TPA: enoyl-CoA hydratase [Candidatus Acidoferrales bacterium]|nr:enoyl-CoA hydratase [Candidatus Acidoferrales bacterium]